MVDTEKRKEMKRFLLIIGIISLFPIFVKFTNGLLNSKEETQFKSKTEVQGDNIYFGEYSENKGVIKLFSQNNEFKVKEKIYETNNFLNDWKNKKDLF
ncbi:MAG: hypothetical protein MJK08_14655 [Campylobacterales bacterium]|nr:hypothetical protein [Campylobacterales bacterium]